LGIHTYLYENDAARILLKDYVNGKLVYAHPPPYLSQHHRYLFQKGEIIRPSIETVSIEDSSMKNKINGQKKKKKKTKKKVNFKKKRKTKTKIIVVIMLQNIWDLFQKITRKKNQNQMI